MQTVFPWQRCSAANPRSELLRGEREKKGKEAWLSICTGASSVSLATLCPSASRPHCEVCLGFMDKIFPLEVDADPASTLLLFSCWCRLIYKLRKWTYAPVTMIKLLCLAEQPSPKPKKIWGIRLEMVRPKCTILPLLTGRRSVRSTSIILLDSYGWCIFEVQWQRHFVREGSIYDIFWHKPTTLRPSRNLCQLVVLYNHCFPDFWFTRYVYVLLIHICSVLHG